MRKLKSKVHIFSSFLYEKLSRYSTKEEIYNNYNKEFSSFFKNKKVIFHFIFYFV